MYIDMYIQILHTNVTYIVYGARYHAMVNLLDEVSLSLSLSLSHSLSLSLTHTLTLSL